MEGADGKLVPASATPPPGLATSATSFHGGAINFPINILLLDTEPKPFPRWMKYYPFASYVIFSLISCYSILYLIFIGIHQANPRMQIQYFSVVSYLEFNAYSILSPLLCPVFMGILAYQVRKHVQLDDGDFFGFLGVLLFFALVNVHDGYGVLTLVKTNSRDYNNLTTSVIDPPPRDPLSRSDFHWQYAWSTRPSCAKKYVRDLVYQHEYDKKHLKKQILVEFVPGRARQAVAASMGTSALDCYDYHDNKTNARIRQWMADLQNEFKCCGPYGYYLWQKWFSEPELTGCKMEWFKPEIKDIPDCYDPLTRWLNGIFFQTVAIMFIQAILYVVAMIFACCHYAAMKYEQEAVVRKYSLLDFSEQAPETTSNTLHRLQKAEEKEAELAFLIRKVSNVESEKGNKSSTNLNSDKAKVKKKRGSMEQSKK